MYRRELFLLFYIFLVSYCCARRVSQRQLRLYRENSKFNSKKEQKLVLIQKSLMLEDIKIRKLLIINLLARKYILLRWKLQSCRFLCIIKHPPLGPPQSAGGTERMFAECVPGKHFRENIAHKKSLQSCGCFCSSSATASSASKKNEGNN